jgi:recombinational DNA repair ATPase RecF
MDDYRAELDCEGSKHILSWLLTEGFQSFISTTEMEGEELAGGESVQFHVEQGKISNISKG